MAVTFSEEFVQPWGPSGPRVWHGSAVPASTTFPFNVGDIVFNNTPAVGQPEMWVCTAAGSPGTWIATVSMFTSGVPHFYSGTAAPVAGTFVRGDIQFNSTPSNGQPSAWICVTAGTPGTWSPLMPPDVLSVNTLTSGTYADGNTTILANPAAGTSNQLPAATNHMSGFALFIKNISANSLTLTPGAAQAYVDATNITLAQNAQITLVSNTTNWYKQA